MSILTALIGPVSDLLDKVVPDADERARLAHEIATLAERQAHDERLAQIEVNKEEAKHSSIFVAGWRPFVGWVCGIALAYNFIAYPILKFIVAMGAYFMGADTTNIPFPELSISELITVLLGMLGLTAARTVEKNNNVARSSL